MQTLWIKSTNEAKLIEKVDTNWKYAKRGAISMAQEHTEEKLIENDSTN